MERAIGFHGLKALIHAKVIYFTKINLKTRDISIHLWISVIITEKKNLEKLMIILSLTLSSLTTLLEIPGNLRSHTNL